MTQREQHLIKEQEAKRKKEARRLRMVVNDISCPYVGESGGCDDCTLGFDTITCQEELNTEISRGTYDSK